MSTGAHRDSRRGKPVAKGRAGRGKPAKRGLNFLPEQAKPIVKAVLAEQGLAGLPVLVCLCRQSGGEIVRCRMEGPRVVLPGPGGQVVATWTLPGNLVEAVGETLTTLAGKEGRTISDLLDKKVTLEVRRRLVAEGYLWARHVVVGMNVLHRLADAAAGRRFWDRPDKLRAWRRSAWATPEDVLPPTVDVVAADYDEAEAAFWDLVAKRLSPADHAALAALEEEHP